MPGVEVFIERIQPVAAALLPGCDTLLTEDLQHGQVLDDRLRIVNPFAGS